MIGCVAKDNNYGLGVVGSMEIKSHKLHYEGVSLDGKRWQSDRPDFVAKNVNEYIERKIHKEYEGAD